MCTPWAAVPLIVGGGVMQANAMRASGKFQQGLSRYNQAALNQSADAVIESGRIAEQKHRIHVGKFKGRQKTSFAASGVDVGQGTPVDILADTAALGEMDAATIRSNAEIEAYNLRTRGVSTRLQGDLARMEGRAGAGGTLLTTAGSVASMDFSDAPNLTQRWFG